MTDKQAAEQYRIAQAQAMIDAFQRERGFAPTVIQLEAWVQENPDKAREAAQSAFWRPDDN